MVEVKRVYHVWFSTKARKPLLEAAIGRDVRASFAEIAKRTSINLLECELEIDHVHLLLELTSDEDLSAAMQHLKGACSRSIFLKYPELKMDLGAFWQKGYGFRQLEPGEVRGLRYYIRTQASRPPRRD